VFVDGLELALGDLRSVDQQGHAHGLAEAIRALDVDLVQGLDVGGHAGGEACHGGSELRLVLEVDRLLGQAGLGLRATSQKVGEMVCVRHAS
jgi:hypothetical protein